MYNITCSKNRYFPYDRHVNLGGLPACVWFVPAPDATAQKKPPESIQTKKQTYLALPRPRGPPCVAHAQEQVRGYRITKSVFVWKYPSWLKHPNENDIPSWFLICVSFPRVTSLTRLPSALVELSEPLQVNRFEQGDFSNAHHDSSPSHSEAACSHTRLAGNKSALSEVSCRCVFYPKRGKVSKGHFYL